MARRNGAHELFVSSQNNPTEEQRSFSRSSGTLSPFCLGCLLPSPLFQRHHRAPNKAHICMSSDFSVWKPCLPSLQDNQDEPQHCRGRDCPGHGFSILCTHHHLLSPCSDTAPHTHTGWAVWSCLPGLFLPSGCG